MEVAKSQPHVAYAVYSHGLSGIWSFLCRTTPSIHDLLRPLDKVITQQLIPTIIGHPTPGKPLCSLFSLPTRFGGLNIAPPSSLLNEYRWSVELSSPLISHVCDSDDYNYNTIKAAQEEVKKKIRLEREATHS